MIVEELTEDPKVKEIVDLAKRRGALIEFVEKIALDKMSETKHHQGVIALVDAPHYVALNSVIENTGREPCVVILDGVQDPQNLGSILRTADAADVDAILIPKREGVGLTPTVLRVSMGGGAHVPVARENIYPAIKYLKEEDFKLVAVDSSGDHDIWGEDLTGAVALVLGGEGEGISPTLLAKCDTVIRIPMHGHLTSLNVGVSAALVLYERLRQREARQHRHT